MATHFLGIRHHGPGSARSVLRSLELLSPDLILVEGPPEAESMLQYVTHQAMKPPVALLIYDVKESHRASFYPFVEFSPEWQAFCYAQTKNCTIRLMDLPVVHKFGLQHIKERLQQESEIKQSPIDHLNEPIDKEPDANDEEYQRFFEARMRKEILGDPLSYFGKLAGYGNGEGWWEKQVEMCQGDDQSLFTAIAEMMRELRESLGGWSYHDKMCEEDLNEFRREASMRKILRKAEREDFKTIVVICGAWHLPALMYPPKLKQDNLCLKGLPKQKVEVTWVPWTYQRLSLVSGYGAGVHSPGWYEHLWNSKFNTAALWLSRVSQLLRTKGIDVSSAHIIETLRLAEALSALRDLSAPRLQELQEAIRTVMLFGEELPLELIRQNLLIGEKIGAVPSSLPATPLERDLQRLQKTLKLKPKATYEQKILDLRKELDLQRSYLLHRLALLGIEWGQISFVTGKGTFKEAWDLEWKPEFVLELVDRSRWGQTIYEATVQFALHHAKEADLPTLTKLVKKVLLAKLDHAIDPLMQQLEDSVAVSSEIGQLLMVIPPMVDIARYSDVRGSESEFVNRVLGSVIPRATIGLLQYCRFLDEETAKNTTKEIEKAHQAILLFNDDRLRDQWFASLFQLIEQDRVPSYLQGKICRLLLDTQQLEQDRMLSLMSLALSSGELPENSAAWIEGFLSGSGQILLYDDELLQMIDQWVVSLHSDLFLEQLPLIRRTFSTFTTSELRQVGERIVQINREHHSPSTSLIAIDHQKELISEQVIMERAKLVLPILKRFLGHTEGKHNG